MENDLFIQDAIVQTMENYFHRLDSVAVQISSVDM